MLTPFPARSLWRPHRERFWHSALRSTALSMALVYLAWNAFWLLHGKLAPSLFLATTGMPCPTTGGTRAVLCLLDGDGAGYFRHNPFALPLLLLLLASLCAVARSAMVAPRVRLPQSHLRCWFALLGLAWTWKLMQFVLCI